MQPIDNFTKANLPEDLFFVRKPEISQGRVVIPSEIASLIACRRGDIILLSARNPMTNASVSFMQTISMEDNKLTMPKAARDAIGIEPLPGQPGFNSGYEYPGIEFHIRALYRAPKQHRIAGRPRGAIVREPNTYVEE